MMIKKQTKKNNKRFLQDDVHNSPSQEDQESSKTPLGLVHSASMAESAATIMVRSTPFEDSSWRARRAKSAFPTQIFSPFAESKTSFRRVTEKYVPIESSFFLHFFEKSKNRLNSLFSDFRHLELKFEMDQDQECCARRTSFLPLVLKILLYGEKIVRHQSPHFMHSE